MKVSDSELSELLKDRATGNLLQFILKASQGSQYVNINSLREIIDDITEASTLESKKMISDLIQEMYPKISE